MVRPETPSMDGAKEACGPAVGACMVAQGRVLQAGSHKLLSWSSHHQLKIPCFMAPLSIQRSALFSIPRISIRFVSLEPSSREGS